MKYVEDYKTITMEKVIAGLKFIAEHYDLEQEDLEEGLLELGCGFSFDDIKRQLDCSGSLNEGMRRGVLSGGATIIANFRKGDFSRDFAYEFFVDEDDDVSIYHFIRTVTGDKSYTKAKVESMREQKVLHKKK